MRARSKYGSKWTEVNGIKFQSKKEAKVYTDLLWQEKLGEITELRRQVAFPLVVNGVPICKYVADFTYYTKEGAAVILEAKGFKTEVFKLKAKLFAALYPELKLTLV